METKNQEKKNNTCRLCKSKKLEIVYSFKKSPVGDNYTSFKKKLPKYDLDLQLCNNCKFVQLSNVIDPNKVYGQYLYVTKTSHGLAEHFYKLYKQLIKKKIVKKNSKVLEIGSNDGTLLKYFKKTCQLLVAVDPAAHLFKDNKIINIGDHFSSECAKKIYSKYLNFDTIIANNVLANIDDLEDVFNGIDKILKPGGHLIVETFSLYGILKYNLIDNIYHEHLSYFTISSFESFASKHNLHLVSVKYLKVKGGSLRFIFKKNKFKKYKFKKYKSIINAIKKEKLIVNNIKLKFKLLRYINNKNALKLNKIIKILKNKKKIAGFGASVGTTSLIYDFKIENKIDLLFDNEKRRHNLYCPGTNIKVLSPKNINKYNFDYIIVFAWRYTKIILKKNKKFFSKKTKFIIPLPKLKVINEKNL